MMRLLAFDFPQDKRALDIADEYMFGPSLLVCPVTQPMYYEAGGAVLDKTEKSREVYLPAGTSWYDLRSGKKYEGGQTITAAADLDSIPVFVKAGSILPLAKPGSSTADMQEEILLQAYAGADGSFTLYEDAGDGYGYEKGEYCVTQITYCDKERKVEWKTEGRTEFRRGEFRVEIVG